MSVLRFNRGTEEETVDLQGSLKICGTDLLKIFGTDICWESKRQPYGLGCVVQTRTPGRLSSGLPPLRLINLHQDQADLQGSSRPRPR